MPDVHPVLFEYEGIPVYMRLSLGCESPEVTRFQGSKGAIELREFSVTYAPQAGVDLSPSYYTASFPARLQECLHEAVARGARSRARTGALRPKASLSTATTTTICGRTCGISLRRCASRKPVVQDVVFGHNAALACHLANESYFRKSPVRWDEASHSIKSLT